MDGWVSIDVYGSVEDTDKLPITLRANMPSVVLVQKSDMAEMESTCSNIKVDIDVIHDNKVYEAEGCFLDYNIPGVTRIVIDRMIFKE